MKLSSGDQSVMRAIVDAPRDIFALARGIGACRRGVAAVEWVAIVSFLAFTAIGVLDFAVVAHHKMQVINAVRAGIQYATVRKPVQQDTTAIEDAIAEAAPADETDSRVIDVLFYCECADGTAVACNQSCATGSRQAYLTITVQEQHELIFDLPFVNKQLTLRSAGTVRLN